MVPLILVVLCLFCLKLYFLKAKIMSLTCGIYLAGMTIQNKARYNQYMVYINPHLHQLLREKGDFKQKMFKVDRSLKESSAQNF